MTKRRRSGTRIPENCWTDGRWIGATRGMSFWRHTCLSQVSAVTSIMTEAPGPGLSSCGLWYSWPLSRCQHPGQKVPVLIWLILHSFESYRHALSCSCAYIAAALQLSVSTCCKGGWQQLCGISSCQVLYFSVFASCSGQQRQCKEWDKDGNTEQLECYIQALYSQKVQ